MSKYYDPEQLPKGNINIYYSEGRRTGKSLEVIGRAQEYLKNLKSSINYYTLYISKYTLQKYGELIKDYIPYNVKVVITDDINPTCGVLMFIKEGDSDD